MSALAWRRLLLEATVLGPMRRTPGRTALSIAAIGLGIALGFAVYLINRTAADEASLAARSLFGLADLAVEAGGEGFDEAFYPRIANLAGVAAASPILEIAAKLPGRRGALTVLGMDAFRSRTLQPAFANALRVGAAQGFEFLDTRTLFLSSAAARDLGLKAGDTIDLQVGLQRLTFKIAGLLPAAALPQRAALMDIAAAQWKFDRLGKLSRVNLRLQPGASPAAVRTALRGLLPASVRIVSPGEAGDDALRLSRAYRSNLTALASVALFTGGFLIYSTQSLAVMRRRRELALLHALGLTRREQALFTMLSGLLVGAIGSILGIVLGGLLSNAALKFLGGDLGAGYFRGAARSLNIAAPEALAFLLLGISVAVLGSLRPALDSANISTAAALKAADVGSGEIKTHGFLAVMSLLAGGALLLLPPLEGLPLPGYASIAMLMLSAVLAIPTITRALLRRLPSFRYVPYEVATAQLRGTMRYASLSVAAIVVSFGLMVAMAIMVSSFRQSLDHWMQKILPADIYVRAGFSGQSAYLDKNAVDALARLPGVERLAQSRLVEANLSSDLPPVALIARNLSLGEIRDSLWLERETQEPLPPGRSPAWISEAAADLYQLRLGANVDLSIGNSRLPVSIRGVWRDYEYQGGAIVLDRDVYQRISGDDRVNTVWLWLQPGGAPDTMIRRVRAALPPGVDLDIRTPGELRRLSLAVFDRTFAITYFVELIAVLIGLFGISASASTQALARRGEFGTLRHLGFTRGQIVAMLAIEGAGLGALGVLIGLVTGLLVGVVLIYVVNRQSFHWSMDFYAPIETLAVLSSALIGAAALTSVISGRGAMSRDAVAAVKEDW